MRRRPYVGFEEMCTCYAFTYYIMTEVRKTHRVCFLLHAASQDIFTPTDGAKDFGCQDTVEKLAKEKIDDCMRGTPLAAGFLAFD